jgi:voltage-gated potassium channel
MQQSFKKRLHSIIFEADSPAGKAFDTGLIIAILTSVAVVMLDSVKAFALRYDATFNLLEWHFTVLFTIEYILRIIAVERKRGYIFSFYGIIDLMAILPTYLSLFLPGSEFLAVIRILRVVRVFRVFKLVQYLTELRSLSWSLRASRRKISVFLFVVLLLTVFIGSIMYVVEGEANGFTSIPRSIYWAVVTLTTVGYGDISPQTPLGQFLAIFIMILGYGIIAVPTGIVTTEMAKEKVSRQNISTQVCPHCSQEGHEYDAIFCKYCGKNLT